MARNLTRLKWFLPTAILIYAVWAVHAQNQPAIRKSASLVLVPVSALDKSDQFVADLSASDFQLLVDGKPVEISNFDAVTKNSLQTAVASESNLAAASPNTFHNISESSGTQPNLVVLLVDYLNTRAIDRLRLRDELLKFFSSGLKNDQEIAVYGLTHSLVLLQPFTRDFSALSSAAKEMLRQKGQTPDPKVGRPLISPSTPRLPSGGGTDAVIEYLTLQNARREFNFDQLRRAADTLAAFRELAASFGGIPGKKTVIWLTGDASPLDPTLLYRDTLDKSVQTPETSWWQTAKTYEAMNAAGISVFPVNLTGITNTGLRSLEGFSAHGETMPDSRPSQPGDMTVYAQGTNMRQGEAAHSILAMDSVAKETGGAVLAGSNDIGELLGRAHKLWVNYYVLAFVPPSSKNENALSYHKISVSVHRHGVRVLARKGYVSRPESMIYAESEIQRDLMEAANSPIDLTSLAVEVSMGPSKDAEHMRHFPFAVTVSGSVLGMPSDKGIPYDISIAVLTRDQNGKITYPAGKRVRGELDEAEASAALSKGLKYNAEFQAPADGPYFGRVIVRDNLSGRTGTLTLALPDASTKSIP
jgi:VWFA-related protein